MAARMPEDHWISLDAGEQEGWLMTKPWGPAYEILVNADAEGGSIEAKLVTPYGETIPDFIRADSVPLTSNGTAQKLTWKSGRSPYDLSVEQFGGVCLKLYLTRAKLYSYTYTLPDPDGNLARRQANARWLDVITHRSGHWGRDSNEPAKGVPPHPRHQSNPAGGQKDFGKQMQESIRNKK